ncbi:MAG: hypothetical protein EOP88_18090, partial [Verrucomicrobiaceae bacterium]
MTEENPTPRLSLAQWLLVLSGTCIACYLGCWYLRIGGGTITLMWPAAGVSVAFFVKYGWRAAPAVAAGHLAVWTFIVPGKATWPILMVPLIYPLEAWVVSRIGHGSRRAASGSGSALWPVVWANLGAPIIACIPCALLMTLTFTLTGRFQKGSMGLSVFLIVMAHLHGIIAVASLTLHLLQKDFNYAELKRSWHGVLAGAAALAVMSFAFAGGFNGLLSQRSALFLPFPLLIMAGVWLSPAPASLFVALWCVLSTAFTCVGLGPFALGSGEVGAVMTPAELGLYNLVMASVAYMISVGSHHLRRQFDLNEIALTAADIGLWEWEKSSGFSWVRGQRVSNYIREATLGYAGIDVLAKLAGTDPATNLVADTWRTRISVGPSPDGGNRPAVLLESVGRILQRGIDDRPTKAIGLLQDLSSLRRAEEAIVALGYQKAKLRDLQSKLSPHFLFNSLNVIRALVHIDPKKADQAITSLAELLRGNLRASETSLIPLGDELVQIRSLLQLARFRFGQRLETRIRVPHELLLTRVPPMLLLNLVENAITHGIGKLEDGGRISVIAKQAGDHIRIAVRN